MGEDDFVSVMNLKRVLRWLGYYDKVYLCVGKLFLYCCVLGIFDNMIFLVK